MEKLSYDFRLRATMPNTIDHRIVIVDLDEKSLLAEGQWPWPRNKVARLVDQLVDHYGVSVVAFDMVFAEPDRSSGLQVLNDLADGALADNDSFKDQLTLLRAELD
ncbi:MAG: CHASE2 domain-containing protein, partial [Gammaproteobacteria bacterium]|nr:CHASE2 domain-containing protein [Gammaproteobacteria bacterium]